MVDRRKPLFFGESATEEVLHRDARLRLDLDPREAASAPRSVDPSSNAGRDRVLAHLPARDRRDVGAELLDLSTAARAVPRHALKECLDRSLAKEVDGVPDANAAAVLELLAVNAALDLEAEEERLHVAREPLGRGRIERDRLGCVRQKAVARPEPSQEELDVSVAEAEHRRRDALRVCLRPEDAESRCPAEHARAHQRRRRVVERQRGVAVRAR